MAEQSFQERTEPATPKRREDARRKGQVAKSLELNAAVGLVLGLLALYVTGGQLLSGLGDTLRQSFTRAASLPVTQATVQFLLLESVWKIGLALAPMFLVLMGAGVGISYAQVGTLFSFEPMQPRWTKLNPISGIKRVIFSQRSLVELLKNLLKTVIVGLVAYSAVEAVIGESLNLMDADPTLILGFMGSASVAVGIKAGLAFLILAAFDYFYQRFDYEKTLRMTREEVRQETKETEGDPLIKGRIRTIQRRIAYRRMMQDVPKADVVVTNPTHLAVALKYDAVKMAAPRVVAKGAGPIAQKIREIAASHHVPIVEDKPLARALFKSVEVGDDIPEKLFQAVAQVLAYVYRLSKMQHRHLMN